MPRYLLAIDVGTLSARAGVFDEAGGLVGAASAGFALYRPAEHHAVYRMAEIWAAVTEAVRGCLAERPAIAAAVAGIAFDATASLALAHTGAAPLDGDADVICWMDHRAEAEAAAITATGDRALAYVGGTLSPEFQLPKLLWLKRRRPEVWSRLTAARDLVDELGFRATGQDRRSLCSFSCKWPYLPHGGEGWRHALLAKLGLDDLLATAGISAPPAAPGSLHGHLTPAAAAELGLPAGVPVAIGVIDAEAGALGVLGKGFRHRVEATLTLIGGTSTCFMCFAPDERRIEGVWGPFKDAVFGGFWLHEGGQSFTGAALDAVLLHHPAGPRKSGGDVHARVVAEIMARLETTGPAFAARRHIVPDWLGNRAPLGDGSVRALLTGIGEETSHESFLETYYATARALALQSRQIIEHLNAHGYDLTEVALSGGHNKNPLLVRLYRDALGAGLVLPDTAEPVLLGCAMLASVAGGIHGDLMTALDAMAPSRRTVPSDPAWAKAHDTAYRTYLRLFAVRNEVEREAAALERHG